MLQLYLVIQSEHLIIIFFFKNILCFIRNTSKLLLCSQTITTVTFFYNIWKYQTFIKYCTQILLEFFKELILQENIKIVRYFFEGVRGGCGVGWVCVRGSWSWNLIKMTITFSIYWYFHNLLNFKKNSCIIHVHIKQGIFFLPAKIPKKTILWRISVISVV